jgi:hypothetical protein
MTRWSVRGCQVDDQIVEAGRLRQGQLYASELDEVVPGGELQERFVLDRLTHWVLCLYACMSMHACVMHDRARACLLQEAFVLFLKP